MDESQAEQVSDPLTNNDFGLCEWYPNHPSCYNPDYNRIEWIQPERFTAMEVLAAQISFIAVAMLEVIAAYLI